MVSVAYYNVSIDNKEVNKMKPNTETIKCAPLKNARELAAMLKQLPRDERLRIEGAITWARMAQANAQDSA